MPANSIKIFNMNFEQHPATPEKIELPPELVASAEQGSQEAASAHDSLTEVAQVMAVNGMSGADREAYLKILDALSRLKQDQKALENYLN